LVWAIAPWQLSCDLPNLFSSEPGLRGELRAQVQKTFRSEMTFERFGAQRQNSYAASPACVASCLPQVQKKFSLAMTLKRFGAKRHKDQTKK
jgi:hypothetical protein